MSNLMSEEHEKNAIDGHHISHDEEKRLISCVNNGDFPDPYLFRRKSATPNKMKSVTADSYTFEGKERSHGFSRTSEEVLLPERRDRGVIPTEKAVRLLFSAFSFSSFFLMVSVCL